MKVHTELLKNYRRSVQLAIINFIDSGGNKPIAACCLHTGINQHKLKPYLNEYLKKSAELEKYEQANI